MSEQEKCPKCGMPTDCDSLRLLHRTIHDLPLGHSLGSVPYVAFRDIAILMDIHHTHESIGLYERIASQDNQLATLTARLAEVEAERDKWRKKYRDISVESLLDDEKRAIRKLIEEHGVVDADLWEQLVTERDAAVKERERLREKLSDMRDDAQFVRGTLLEMAEALTPTPGAEDES